MGMSDGEGLVVKGSGLRLISAEEGVGVGLSLEVRCAVEFMCYSLTGGDLFEVLGDEDGTLLPR